MARESHSESIPAPATLVLVWLGLMLLLALTAGSAWLPLGPLNIVVNLGMVIGLLPVVGVPLPLFSYGGTSMVTTMIGVGILLSVSMRRFMF